MGSRGAFTCQTPRQGVLCSGYTTLLGLEDTPQPGCFIVIATTCMWEPDQKREFKGRMFVGSCVIVSPALPVLASIIVSLVMLCWPSLENKAKQLCSRRAFSGGFGVATEGV